MRHSSETIVIRFGTEAAWLSQEETRQERKPESELVGIWGDASIQKKKECAAIGIKMCWNSGSRVDTNSHVFVLMTPFQDYWQCDGVTTCHKQTVIQEKSNLSKKKKKIRASFTHFLLPLSAQQNILAPAVTKRYLARATLQYEILFKFWVSERPLIMKHFCFWRQNEPCFLNIQWCIGGRNTFLKQMYGISEREREKNFDISSLSWLPPVL